MNADRSSGECRDLVLDLADESPFLITTLEPALRGTWRDDRRPERDDHAPWARKAPVTRERREGTADGRRDDRAVRLHRQLRHAPLKRQ